MIGFTGGWLDRADHLRGDAAAMAGAATDPAARLLRMAALEPALDDRGRLVWDDLAGAAVAGELLFLGVAAGRPHFVAAAPGVRGGPRSPAMARMLDVMAPGDAAVFGTARQLVNWHGRHRFCANCGAQTVVIRGGWARHCPDCGTEHYPRTDPVVIMVAEHDGHALVGRGASWPAGRYSALAGFVEPGESVEEAVAREVWEEAGVRVRDVRYLASQPWPFPGQLMIACIGTAEARDLTVDAAELVHAMWVTRAEVRAALAGEPDARFLAPPVYAIAHTLLRAWAGGSDETG